jgi:hypothetical protein
MTSYNNQIHNLHHNEHIELFTYWKENPDKCPCCLGNLKSFKLIDGFESNMSYKIKKKYNEKTDVKIFIKHFHVITPKHQLMNQAPAKWLDDITNNALLPLYKLYTNDNEPIYIDYHLRQLIIWDEVIPSDIVEYREYEAVYYSSNSILFNKLLNYNHTIDIITTILKWVYEAMISLSDKYNFIYENTMNTFIIDIIILTIIKNKDNDIGTKKNIYYIILASIYNCYSFYKNEGELDTVYLMSLTDDYEPNEDKLLHISGIQEEYIEEYFEYLK